MDSSFDFDSYEVEAFWDCDWVVEFENDSRCAESELRGSDVQYCL